LTTQAPFANINEAFSQQMLADNFALGEDALVGTVEWWGTSLHHNTGQEVGVHNLSAFRIQIFAADGISTTGAANMPGTLIAEEDIGIGDIALTPGQPGPYTG